MTTMDPGKYCEYMENLQQEEQRPVALNEIKNLLTYMPNSEAASILNNIGIAPIFNCLQVKDKAQFDSACELLKLCFEKFKPGEVIKQYTGQIMFLLRHESSCLRKLALDEVHRALQDNPHLHVPDYIDMFVAVSQLVADSDVGIANKAILVTSNLPKGAYPKVLEEMKIALKLNSSSKCNALETVINVSSYSMDLLELASSLGYFNFLLAEIDSGDVLYQVNIMELLSRLAATPHGIYFLVNLGTLDRIADSIAMLKDNPYASLLLPGYMKFFGVIAHLYPREILGKYPLVVECIYDVFESKDQTVLLIAIDTLGYIGITIEGKLCLTALGSRYIEVLEKVCELIRTGPADTKTRAVTCLANLVSVENDQEFKPPIEPRISLMTREWFRGMSVNPGSMEYLLTMCKNPFMDIRFAAFNLLDAVCQHRWGEEMVMQTAGFIEYLLDRTVDHSKESKELKFEIIKRLSDSPVFDAKTSLTLKKFVEEGPFYNEPALDVAMQEGD